MAWAKESRRRKELPANWAALRRRVLERDNHTCVLCGKKATHVDHIKRGGDHSSLNLRALCQTCHMARTGRDGGRTQRKPKPSTKRLAEQHPGWLKQGDNK